MLPLAEPTPARDRLAGLTLWITRKEIFMKEMSYEAHLEIQRNSA